MTPFEDEAMSRKEKDKSSISSAYLELKPPYLIKVAAKPYPSKYAMPKFQKFDERKGNTTEMLCASLIF